MRRTLCRCMYSVDAGRQFRPDEGIDEVGRANLHRRRAGDDELEGVNGARDAAHANDRNLHRPSALVNHAHRDWPYGRSAQATDDVRQLRPSGLDVDRHREEGVDERHGICAGILRRLRD